MRNALAAAALAAACSGEQAQRYVGAGTAIVEPRGRPAESRTRTDEGEEIRLRRLDDGRFELVLDDCRLSTGVRQGDRATIPAGTRCRAGRLGQSAEIVVESGQLTVDDGARTVALRLEGSGQASHLGSDTPVLFRYRFSGSLRD